MRRESGQYSAKLARESAHQFSAEGYAPFIKAPGGCVAQWNLSGDLSLAASGGLISTPTSLSAIGTGSFRITPIDVVRIRVEYRDPLYLLKYDKLSGTLRNRFDFELDMGSGMSENLWPYLFDYYMKTDEWPLKRREYASIFRSALRAVDSKWMQRSQTISSREKLRARVRSALLTRLDKRRSADALAAEAGHITHQIISSEFYGELIAEMQMLRSIPSPQSVVPLAVERADDEIHIKIPFEIAQPKRIMIFGVVKVDYRWEYGEFFDKTFICSSLELYPQSSFVLQEYCRLVARRAHVPLDEGAKRVYGIRLDAPMICKAQKVKFEFLKAPGRFLPLKRPGETRPLPPTDPTNLRLRFRGTEA